MYLIFGKNEILKIKTENKIKNIIKKKYIYNIYYISIKKIFDFTIVLNLLKQNNIFKKKN
ncbi:hypothetical protein C3B56_00265 [Candidatus Annandia adelgestsuga]|uniref:Uncharacterized protein n=1 Tax=Candidatus Annandia adelgestsuga TaxID=1302411 RepID=A0A3S5HNY0_9ENTR|nr:hypothetical protein C3B56_00265 [Candidatus Annandia adelgestsuga]